MEIFHRGHVLNLSLKLEARSLAATACLISYDVCPDYDLRNGFSRTR